MHGLSQSCTALAVVGCRIPSAANSSSSSSSSSDWAEVWGYKLGNDADASALPGVLQVQNQTLFSPFLNAKRSFAKTGLGETTGNQNKGFFRAALPEDHAADRDRKGVCAGAAGHIRNAARVSEFLSGIR